MKQRVVEKIHIVLVEPSHAGNIGAAARAMKTMGLNQLTLVNPRDFPSEQAYVMSSHADDVLDQARVVDTLDEALANCIVAIGTSARSRSLEWPLETPEQSARRMVNTADMEGAVALVFGRERTGLTNHELQRCQYHVNIPSNPEYSSLNLAAAVQIMAYELRLALLDVSAAPADESAALSTRATRQEVEGFLSHLLETLNCIEFFDGRASEHLFARIRRLYDRAHLETAEVHLLRGILKKIQTALKAST